MGLVLFSPKVYSFLPHITIFPLKAGGYMEKKLLTLLFTLVFAFSLSMSLFAQEGTKKEEAKETPAQEKAEKAEKGQKAGKQARWEGIVTRSNKDKSNLTVRQRSTGAEKTVQYDSSTKWTSQEHHSKKVNDIDASQVKDGDRVICIGTYDKDGVLHATLISKRLTN